MVICCWSRRRDDSDGSDADYASEEDTPRRRGERSSKRLEGRGGGRNRGESESEEELEDDKEEEEEEEEEMESEEEELAI